MWPVIDTKEFLKKKKLENMQSLGKKQKVKDYGKNTENMSKKEK